MCLCAGSYKKVFPNIQYVGSTVIVAWKGVDEAPNCRADSDTRIDASQTEYVKCIQNAIENSLANLFSKAQISSIDTIVMPALGTGTGRVAKGVFYRAAAKCAGEMPNFHKRM